MFMITSTRIVDDSVFAQTTFTLSDSSMQSFEVAVFRPASTDDILNAVASQNSTLQSKIDATAAVQALDTSSIVNVSYKLDENGHPIPA